MEVNWTLIISYAVIVIISTITPLITIFSVIVGIPVALLLKNARISQVFSYSIIWLMIALLWRHINGTPFPLTIELIILTILTLRRKFDNNLDINGHNMVRAELYSIILVSINSAIIIGFSWF